MMIKLDYHLNLNLLEYCYSMMRKNIFVVWSFGLNLDRRYLILWITIQLPHCVHDEHG